MRDDDALGGAEHEPVRIDRVGVGSAGDDDRRVLRASLAQTGGDRTADGAGPR